MSLPKPKSLPGLFLYGIVAAAVIMVVRLLWAIFDLNFEQFATANGWDKLLANNALVLGRWFMDNLFWVSMSTAFAVAFALGAWATLGVMDIDRWWRGRTRGAPAVAATPIKAPEVAQSAVVRPPPQAPPPIPVGLMTAPRPKPPPAPVLGLPNLWPADYAAWDHVDPLTIRQAACLWVNRDPEHLPGFRLDGPAAGRLQALLQAAQAFRITTSGTLPIQETTNVSRSDLVKYADDLGERPAFLFRDARP